MRIDRTTLGTHRRVATIWGYVDDKARKRIKKMGFTYNRSNGRWEKVIWDQSNKPITDWLVACDNLMVDLPSWAWLEVREGKLCVMREYVEDGQVKHGILRSFMVATKPIPEVRWYLEWEADDLPGNGCVEVLARTAPEAEEAATKRMQANAKNGTGPERWHWIRVPSTNRPGFAIG